MDCAVVVAIDRIVSATVADSATEVEEAIRDVINQVQHLLGRGFGLDGSTESPLSVIAEAFVECFVEKSLVVPGLSQLFVKLHDLGAYKVSQPSSVARYWALLDSPAAPCSVRDSPWAKEAVEAIKCCGWMGLTTTPPPPLLLQSHAADLQGRTPIIELHDGMVIQLASVHLNGGLMFASESVHRTGRNRQRVLVWNRDVRAFKDNKKKFEFKVEVVSEKPNHVRLWSVRFPDHVVYCADFSDMVSCA